jgi:hypothetical protein
MPCRPCLAAQVPPHHPPKPALGGVSADSAVNNRLDHRLDHEQPSCSLYRYDKAMPSPCSPLASLPCGQANLRACLPACPVEALSWLLPARCGRNDGRVRAVIAGNSSTPSEDGQSSLPQPHNGHASYYGFFSDNSGGILLSCRDHTPVGKHL